MIIHPTELEGVVILDPQVFGDHRGYFFESYNQEKLALFGFEHTFVQDNVSLSTANVLRGLHYQWPIPQGKLVQCLQGEVWDVAVDIRESSPTFGQWHAETLTGENHRALYIPEGFAHGFAVISDTALVSYKCTQPYRAEQDAGILYNDPTFAIPWPIIRPVLSPKDQALPTWDKVAPERRPQL